ncbi:hypothetical protein N7481_005422 [Penicillium waksmanii]|uniref:uncharacterized protein n=1 Tax=Penicillium waksmanii TaxID=69791 RepID=UPI0025475506|nr:uncharacterized protein N7481_005422 [Penicillium waksmanii]KAJ5983323.1 hypothetical protein N7481_005422 [Penicillium waksmanii]
MVTTNALFVRDDWVKKSRAAIKNLEPSFASPTSKRAMDSQDAGPPPRKRESRSGTRKVAALSSEQLERKRANDREAQRSIRQRTKEHIEQLETQVSFLQAQIAEMRSQNDQFQEILQRNAALEDEVGRLKRQLAYSGHPGMAADGEEVLPYPSSWHSGEDPGNSASNVPEASTMLPSSQFAGSSHPFSSRLPRTPSAVSMSSRSSHPQDWQQYTNTRSPSLGEASGSELPGRMESYVLDGHMQQGARLALPPSIALSAPQINYCSTASPSQHSTENSFAEPYSVSQRGGENPHSSLQSSIDHVPSLFLPSQRTQAIPMPGVSPAAQPASAQSYQAAAAPYQDSLPRQKEHYPYPWKPQS